MLLPDLRFIAHVLNTLLNFSQVRQTGKSIPEIAKSVERKKIRPVQSAPENAVCRARFLVGEGTPVATDLGYFCTGMWQWSGMLVPGRAVLSWDIVVPGRVVLIQDTSVPGRVDEDVNYLRWSPLCMLGDWDKAILLGRCAVLRGTDRGCQEYGAPAVLTEGKRGTDLRYGATTASYLATQYGMTGTKRG
eukprot:1509323-Rhodomonas_salina.2